MSYTITKNPEFNSIEVSFNDRPSQAIRDALKSIKFRWHSVKRVWYGYTDENTVRKALGEDVTEDAPAEVKAKTATPQDHLRIYYNGFKVDGKHIGCGYSLDNNAEHEPSVTIYAKNYDDLPGKYFDVKNDTDIYTDYFDKDHAYITPQHPLYRFIRYAAEKAQARADKRYCEKLRESLSSGKPEPWAGHYDTLRKDLERREAFIRDFEAKADPGQPTQEDLDAVAAQAKAAADARRAEEEAERKAEQAQYERFRNDGRAFLDQCMQRFPVSDDMPKVTICWSEHPAFYGWKDGELVLSLRAADIALGTLDAQVHHVANAGYFKTSFSITGEDESGEPIHYTGRYDLGDGEGGLINHILNFGTYYLTHDDYGNVKPEPDETNDVVELAKYLKSCLA